MRHKIFIKSKGGIYSWFLLIEIKKFILYPDDPIKRRLCYQLLDLIIVQIKSHIWNSLFLKIKGKEGFRHTWFHQERDAECCMISRTPELRERILLFSHQVFFFILRGDERPPRERLCHCGGEGTLLMIYIASRNSTSTYHKFRPLINNTSFTRVDDVIT